MNRFQDWCGRAHERLRGYRTFIIFSPIALMSFLDALHAIDLTPLFVWLNVPEPSRGGIMTGMAILAIFLRVYTTTPPLQRDPMRRDEDRH